MPNPSTEAGEGISDLLRRMIERHAAAYAYFDSVVYMADSSVLGREATVDEEAVYVAASDGEKQALLDICYFPARDEADMAAKARYLLKRHSVNFDHLDNEQVENLLRSMLPEAERDAIVDEGAPRRSPEPARTVTGLSFDGNPIFEPAKLSMFELYSLYDALDTVASVIDGLCCQPRFTGSNSVAPLPPAGDMLQTLCEFIGLARDDIYHEAIDRPAETEADQEKKLFFLGARLLDGSTAPKHAMKELSAAVAKLGKAVQQ